MRQRSHRFGYHMQTIVVVQKQYALQKICSRLQYGHLPNGVFEIDDTAIDWIARDGIELIQQSIASDCVLCKNRNLGRMREMF